MSSLVNCSQLLIKSSKVKLHLILNARCGMSYENPVVHILVQIKQFEHSPEDNTNVHLCNHISQLSEYKDTSILHQSLMATDEGTFLVTLCTVLEL